VLSSPVSSASDGFAWCLNQDDNDEKRSKAMHFCFKTCIDKASLSASRWNPSASTYKLQ